MTRINYLSIPILYHNRHIVNILIMMIIVKWLRIKKLINFEKYYIYLLIINDGLTGVHCSGINTVLLH